MTGQRTDLGSEFQAITAFERELWTRADVVDDVWVELGKRIGLDNLVAVFHAVGGQVVSVPSRETFMRRLYVPYRDQQVLEMRRAGLGSRRIARELRLSLDTVKRARCRALRTRPRGR